MAWGRSSGKPPPPPSTFSKVLPLLILLVVVSIFAFVGYQLYLSVQRISDAAAHKLETKNVTFTKDGVRVGVKEVRNENYVDTTQSFLVKAWNLSTWPGYKSKLWNQPKDEGKMQSRRGYVQGQN